MTHDKNNMRTRTHLYHQLKVQTEHNQQQQTKFKVDSKKKHRVIHNKVGACFQKIQTTTNNKQTTNTRGKPKTETLKQSI